MAKILYHGDMKAVVAVPGKFHGFDLARELDARGVLARLITSYPRFAASRGGIPKEKIRSIVVKEVLERGWKKLPSFARSAWNPQYAILELYDRLASRLLLPCDISVGWSSASLHTMRRAKERYGAVTVLERGSSHIVRQTEILREESRLTGVRVRYAHPKVVEKELREYEEADYISIPSLFVKNTFLEQGVPESKLIHVPYGVDLSRFRQVPKEDGVFRVVFAGGMILRKGVHYLMQAFAELKLPNSELLLIGTPSDEMRPFFEKYQGSYRFLGHVPQRELYKHYSQGSVFAMMSIEEGLAMVVAQAIS